MYENTLMRCYSPQDHLLVTPIQEEGVIVDWTGLDYPAGRAPELDHILYIYILFNVILLIYGL